MTSPKACKTYTRMARSCGTFGRAHAMPAGNALGNASGGLASVGDLAKIKTKEKAKAEHRRCISTIVFDKWLSRTEPSEPAVKLAGQLGKRTIWYNGDAKEKPRQQVRPECSKLISQLYQTEGYLTSSTDELKRQTREKK